MKTKFIVSIVSLLFLSAAVFAQQSRTSIIEVQDPLAKQFDIDVIEETTVITEEPAPPGPANWQNRTKGGGGGGGASADLIMIEEIVNLTAKGWQLIKENAPVVNTSNTYATAVPNFPKSWTMLTGWKGPKIVTKRKVYKNWLFGDVIELKYSLRFQYGGSYDGKGKFLTGVSIEVDRLYVFWGYDFDVKVHIPDNTVTNIGKTTQDPVAAMLIQITYAVDGKSITSLTDTYAINALGDVKEMSEQAHIKAEM